MNLLKLSPFRSFHPKETRLFAFTLAEVLITLGIIGVVAAMTIPNLISNYQKHIVETNLKETYSILQQTMKFTEYDDVAFEMNIPDSIAGTRKWFETYMQPYLKYSAVCFNERGCWNDKGLTRTLAGGLPYSYNSPIGIGQG
ncbi:MAG: type II secretion system GspH family protein, partial [Candidatus Gastranaerophilales bacterium]|nr:type II secretion system GspH family protein [Candidatus Gastranaerophilales bacterium]